MGFPHPAANRAFLANSERGGFPIVGLRSRGNGVDQVFIFNPSRSDMYAW
jgi:hypothetical protein